MIIQARKTKGCRACNRVVFLDDFDFERYRCVKCVETNALLSAEQRVMENRGWTLDDVVRVWNSTKQCGKCKEVKIGYLFGLSSRGKTGLSSGCRECESSKKRNLDYKPTSTQAKQYKENHKLTGKRSDLRPLTRKSLSDDAYEDMLILQEFRCGICRRHQNEFSKTFATDHDHRCCPGKVSCGKCLRGLLCNRCNPGIGIFNDDVEILQNAIDYLNRYKGDM
jgi:hypothetical protein